MGYIVNHCIVVTGGTNKMRKVATKVRQIAKNTALESQVSNLQIHPVNGESSLFIAPDGSKEGWNESDSGNAARRKIIDFLLTVEGLDWFEARYGGDFANTFIEQKGNCYV